MLIFVKILIGLSTMAPAAVQRIHNGRRSKFGARSTRRVRWRPEGHSEMWSELLQQTTQGQILGRNHQRFGRQWFRMIIIQLSWIVATCIYDIVHIVLFFATAKKVFTFDGCSARKNLRKHGPYVVTMRVYEDFLAYKSGISYKI